MGGQAGRSRPGALLEVSESQRARELREANLRDAQERAWQKSVRRVFLVFHVRATARGDY